MNTPKRITLSRKRGWKMPPNTVKVDRATKWGNPWKVGEPHPADGHPMSAKECVALFEATSLSDPEFITAAQQELRGENLGCWCKEGEPCHADPLLLAANT